MSGRDLQTKMQFLRSSAIIIQPGGGIFQVN